MYRHESYVHSNSYCVRHERKFSTYFSTVFVITKEQPCSLNYATPYETKKYSEFMRLIVIHLKRHFIYIFTLWPIMNIQNNLKVIVQSLHHSVSILRFHSLWEKGFFATENIIKHVLYIQTCLSRMTCY